MKDHDSNSTDGPIRSEEQTHKHVHSGWLHNQWTRCKWTRS